MSSFSLISKGKEIVLKNTKDIGGQIGVRIIVYDIVCCAKALAKSSQRLPLRHSCASFFFNGKKYIEMPLIFRMNIGTKAILLIVIYPPSSVNNNKLLNFGIKCLDTIVKQLYLCDKKGKKLKQKFYDWDVNRWIRLGAWHGV